MCVFCSINWWAFGLIFFHSILDQRIVRKNRSELLKLLLTECQFFFFFTLQVQRKRRIKAKTKCKNIKDECPKPNCPNPVLLPGQCCKLCPGQSICEYLWRTNTNWMITIFFSNIFVGGSPALFSTFSFPYRFLNAPRGWMGTQVWEHITGQYGVICIHWLGTPLDMVWCSHRRKPGFLFFSIPEIPLLS